MSQCSKCGSQSTTFKEGISKKNGKPWKGYKCDDCGDMVFLNKFKALSNTQTASPIKQDVTLETLNKKIDLILKHLDITGQSANSEETPF